MAAVAQTAAKPATHTTKPATAKTAPASTAGATAGAVKYPSGKKAEPQVKKTLFALKVQDIKIGTGAEAEPLKMYKVKYTGWRAADGLVFDSWDQHPTPVMGADGKPETDADGKPKTTAPQPASFPVGMGRMIPGFDQGFAGMHVGGIRRIFIPWQLGYGSRAIPDRDKDHPGIPSKSDLVFEVELVDMAELPAPPHPTMPGSGASPHSGAPPSGSAPSTPPPSQPSTPPSDKPSTPPPSDKPSTPQSK
jgi:peptidylprolyl isomerase